MVQVNLKDFLTFRIAKVLGGTEVKLHALLALELDGDKWLHSGPDCFTD
jgi:hypothetical protein